MPLIEAIQDTSGAAGVVNRVRRTEEFAVAAGLLGHEGSVSGYENLGRRVVFDLFEVLPEANRDEVTVLRLAAAIGNQEPPVKLPEDRRAYALGAMREAAAVIEGITT